MQTLTFYRALIIKDTPRILPFMAALLVLNLLAIIYIRMYGSPQYLFPTPDLILWLVNSYRNGYETILAGVLALVLNLEWMSGARFQILSLPVRRYQSILSMTVIVVTLGIIVSILTSCFGKLIVKPFGHMGNFLFFLGERAVQVGENATLYCGMVCFAQGVMTIIKRYRFAVWIFSFLAVICLYALVKNGIILPLALHDSSWEHSPLVTYYDWEAGLVFLIAGLFLFDRYAEA